MESILFLLIADNFTAPFSKPLKEKKSLTGPVITGSFEKQAPGEKVWIKCTVVSVYINTMWWRFGSMN